MSMSMLHRNVETARFLAEDPVGQARGGATPHEIVHRQGKVALRYFAPAEATQAPLFISMPLINTWTVWDLLPGRSLVEKLLAAGFPVYLLDWGRPGPEDSETPLTWYVDEVIGRALDRARRHAGTDVLDAVGYCVGGTFLSVHLARHPEAVRRMALVCAPIDFRASGRLASWADRESFPLDDIVDGFGNFPAEKMRESFAWLKPSGQTRKWVSLWERIEDPAFRELWAALEQWNADNVDFPGEAYREYVRRCYFDNALIEGGWVMGGRPVDLSQCKIPALAIGASGDHIAPPAAAFGLERAWGGPVTCTEIAGGHVGVSVGGKLPKALIAWLQEA